MPDLLSFLQEREEQIRRGAANNVAMQARDPRTVARAQAIAKRYGLTPAHVEADPKRFEEQLNRDEAEEVFGDQPWMAPFLLDNPDTAAMIGNEIPKIGQISTTLGVSAARQSFLGNVSTFERPSAAGAFADPSNLPSRLLRKPPAYRSFREEAVRRGQYGATAVAGEMVGKAVGGAVATAAQGVLGMFEAASDPLTQGAWDPYFRQQEEVYRGTLENMRLDWMDPSSTLAGVQSGLTSTALMLLPLPFGKAKILPTLTGITFGEAYSRYQSQGESGLVAGLGAAGSAAIEYGTEVLPFKYLLGDDMLKGGVKNFFNRYILPDVIGEQFATLGQEAIDTAMPNSGKTWKEYWEERPAAAYQTLVATATMTALVGGGAGVMARFDRAVDTTRDSTEAMAGQAILDNVMERAEKVEMRVNAPEEFARFINEGAKNSPVKHVYIPVEAVDAALADETLPAEEKQALSFYQDQIEEARISGGEIVVPIGEAAARFAGTKMWQSLREDARVLAGGISGREAREQMDKLTAELESIGTEAVAEAGRSMPALEAKAAVYNEVRDQAIAAGRSAREAQTTALLVASRAENLASGRYGRFKDAGEAWQWMQLEIRKGAAAKGGRTMAQAERAVVNIGLAVNDGSSLTVEEAVKALREQGVEVTEQEVRQSESEPTLIATLNKPLSAEQANAVSAALRQDAIAQRVGEAGELYGPAAEKWGPFNPDYFLSPTERTEAGWTEARVDELIRNYGYHDGSSKAFAVMLTPDQYLGLTASSGGRKLIEQRVNEMPEYGGKLDLDQLRKSGAPTLVVTRGNEPSNWQKSRGIERLDDRVVGHEGRHRMTLLKKAGIDRVPVVVVLQDATSKIRPTAPATLHLASQRSRSDQIATGDIKAFDVAGIPINWEHRDQLIAMGGTTMFQSDLSALEQAASLSGAFDLARRAKYPNMRAFKKTLQELVKATSTGNLRDKARLTRLAIADARVALRDNANAIGWYDEKLQQAMAVLSELHPEIKTDEDARFAFIYALAVTSTGLKVDRNFRLADIVYRQYKKTGKMPEDVGEGNGAAAMKIAFTLFNRFTGDMGIGGLRDFMTTEHTVGEIEKALGVPVNGEHKGTRVMGAAFLGPKIGNGYFSNLYGNYDQLTMDRWFMRTWGRWTGTLIVNRPEAIKDQRQRVLSILRGLTPAQRKEVDQLLSTKGKPFKTKLSDVDAFAERVRWRTAEASVRDALAAIHPRLRLDPKQLHLMLDGQKESPANAAERNEIRSIMRPVLMELQRDNPELTMADLQAVLWYPEKTLYDTAKAKAGEVAKTGYENEEAPDYANAAVALARSEGISEEKISAAITRANGRVAAARRAARAGRSAATGGGGAAIRIPEDEAGFPLEEGLSSQGDGQLDPVSFQQFGGQIGAMRDTRVRTLLERYAELAEADTYSEEELWQMTGWRLGADDKLRFEISDDQAEFNELPDMDEQSFEDAVRGIDYLDSDPILRTDEDSFVIGKRLRDVLKHPTLFRFYPELANMPVFVRSLAPNEGGYYDWGRIVLNGNMGTEHMLTTVLHEIQHAVQHIEGFANGAPSSAEDLRAAGYGDKLDVYIEWYTAINEGRIPNASFERVMTEEEIVVSAAYATYKAVAGEVEARLTEARRTMDPAERRTYFPKDSVPRQHQIVRLPAEGMPPPPSLSATMEQGPRGEATFYPDGKTIVTLFGKADFSTMLHELSHVFLNQEFRLAQEKGASKELKADVEKLRKWFSEHGHEVGADVNMSVGAHELFARTAERYFREGKAPSAELRGAFKQFREWLTNVYKTVKDLLAYGPAPINPEIRDIMDRMIATSDAIADNEIAPMSQEQLGMTAAEYSAYLDSVNTARDEAHDKLLERMMKAIRRREKTKVASERANVRADVAEQINSEPRFIALHLLRTGRWLNDPSRAAEQVKINTGWLIDNYGEEVLAQLPVGLQPLHRGDGLIGDVIAEMVGLPSGDALVQSLREIKLQSATLKADGNPRPLRDHLIEERTNEIMAERHGDIAMSEQEIEEEAIAAINSNRQGEVLAAELRQLRKKNAQPGAITPYQILREWARRKVNEGTVADAVSKSALQRYVRGFNRARQAFEEAILGNKPDEAIRQKQAQMINHALLAEGKVVADEINAIVRRMQRYARTKAMSSIDQDYMDRIHELLEGYNFRPVSMRAREEKAAFEEWAAKQREQGHEVYVPPRFRDERTHWQDAKVAKLLELNDMVTSLAAQGKLKQKLTTARDERARQEIIDDAESRILNLPPRELPHSSTGRVNKPFRQSWREAKTMAEYRQAIANLFSKQKVREFTTGLIKIEGLMDILDGTKDATGPLNKTVIQPATDAANTFSRLLEEVMDPIIARYRSMSGKQAARMHDFVTIPELTLNVSMHEADTERLGQPLTISRSQLLGLIANTGNLSNLSKLVGGERWGDPESMTDLMRVRDILISHASKEDLDLVQDMWNGVAKLWPHIAKVERELSGIVPEEVVPLELETPYGTYSGGYWPVVWDSVRSEMGKRQGEEAETSLQGVGFGIGTPKGHTITRTGAMAPMEWQMEHVLFTHLTKVISRVAYAPWIRDVLKVVDHPRITGAIRLRMGDEYVAAIKPWIRDQIPSNIQDVAGAKFWEKFLNQTRINMSIAVLGVSYTTGLAQMLGLSYSAGVLGEGSVKDGGKWMALGLAKTIQQQKDKLTGAQEFVFARSEELQRRAHEVNQESTEVFRRLKDRDTVLRKLQAAAFWHIGFIDLNMVAIPTWMGAYHKSLSQGGTEQDAIAYAEKVVRLSQSSGRKKDLSAIQRGNAGQKFIAMFYTPSSVFFNQQWEAAQHIKAGNWSKALAPTFYFLVMTTLLDAFREGDWPEDDEEDGLGGVDIAEWVGRNLLFGAFYGIPVVRDATNATERKLRGEYAEYGNTPITALASAVEKGTKSGVKMWNGEETEGRDIKNIVSAIGFLFGLPGNQPGKTGGYIEDVTEGRVEPQTPSDWYEGLAYGKQSTEQE